MLKADTLFKLVFCVMIWYYRSDFSTVGLS